ncbi:Rieske (2Fe-2S) region [Trichormus variabilis ATCC 29413]|uniref:Rieske (2Fe-2S) region n=2 Tax=Anabaena variabilis TaxID=264691 RepID=Q3M4F0_TRIV2|nr:MULTISPECIES: ubiquinol-cytochrome c reductase iron-sulfur subunit [Nostocaceae]ABA24136.1 Rieske (2Fe-2S) region [Trichormus variabilis ATCC 29413]MBC1215219.1 ubiquinol-cytochrome c reductase iron-sulfur subunit [Trichormus variabilis ARAD]MBC1255652.1 ubiquinol-cytochrome c reductase iron-sulfur subunit [Trichormus variabilis V5]MBC1266265.1 ubiquinol-cytochrome c reductase iron-sulfur subunit [Trichormus variabilis FSR]MBC1302004.1 ubiquinol-cytochrome c reductase iron-sulfur subunit [T
MKRRDFINWVGLGWIASSLPVAIAACSSQPVTSTEGQAIGTVAELDKTGQLLNENSPIGPVLVVGTSKDANLIAVNPTCSHKGCTVAWQAQAKKFVCPCHGAEYGVDGKVQKDPATKPLKTYAAKIEGDSVVVKQS